MHESSLVSALLRQVEALVAQHAGARAAEISVAVGEFSGVEPELLEAAFDRLMLHSPLRGAVLRTRRVPLEARCRGCETQFFVQRYAFCCPHCGDTHLHILGGEELLLESVTMEETP